MHIFPNGITGIAETAPLTYPGLYPYPNSGNTGTITLQTGASSMSNLIYAKMSKVMSEIGSVSKDQKNQAQGFKFRGIDQFVNALYPALVRNGVFMAPRCVSEKTELKEVVRGSGKAGIDKHVTILMEYRFYCEDGSSVVIGPIPAEGLDSGDKATNKALSAALKYALIQTFSVPTEDMAEADLETPVIGVEPRKQAEKSPSVSGVTTIAITPQSTVTTAVVSETAVLAKEELPAPAVATVEPIRKSSFRKSKQTPATAPATETPTDSEWSN